MKKNTQIIMNDDHVVQNDGDGEREAPREQQERQHFCHKCCKVGHTPKGAQALLYAQGVIWRGMWLGYV